MSALLKSNCRADGPVIIAPLIPDMEAFESLPVQLRDYLNYDAGVKYSALQVRSLCDRYGAAATLHALKLCDNTRMAA
jgi:hypothetical protein